MFKKSSVFMMLLAASLIGIGSATYIQSQIQVAQGQPTQKAPVLKQQERVLADRILPYIIQKMDGQTLAQKVLPYLEVKPTVSTRTVTVLEPAYTAQCKPGETQISRLTSVVTCLSVNVGLKDVQQPQQPSQPSGPVVR